ncbi:Flp family type IVb pilin [Agrococcus sp. ARC_14]|uniref:Flp family type IVb pilin n=1 Tax=Agrococcus sp. ARC_14 TaxID=2919927 RepID=UPI001F062062|nr:Flp family type IVb pilin [Agrococcus sp. ARC_14]MCH1883730.1 Flp family type IVb pilin [Agrococcus sp. ARC_14]
MFAMLSAVSAFVSDRFDKKNDRGATAVEYGLLVGLMAVAVVAAVVLLAPILGDLFGAAGDQIGAGTVDVENGVNTGTTP